MFTTFKQVIEAWDSIDAFAADVGTSANTAKGMKHRNSIPPDYWVKAIAGAERRGIDGVTLETLARLAAKRFQRAVRSGRPLGRSVAKGAREKIVA